MIIKELPSNFKFYLAYSEEEGQLPLLYGFEDEHERDDVYNNYLVTGEIEIIDFISGSFKSLNPTLVGKLDLPNGCWLCRDSKYSIN